MIKGKIDQISIATKNILFSYKVSHVTLSKASVAGTRAQLMTWTGPDREASQRPGALDPQLTTPLVVSGQTVALSKSWK